ncbi:MAG: hypothetical protein ACUZ8H_16370 [Candidatus Anammoxibacter sp.]
MESTFEDKEDAAKRVCFLNGGRLPVKNDDDSRKQNLKEISELIKGLGKMLGVEPPPPIDTGIN